MLAHAGGNMNNDREQYLIRAAVTSIMRSARMPLSIAQITGALQRTTGVRLTAGEVKQAVFALQRAGSIERAAADVGIARYLPREDDDSTDPGIRIDGEALNIERAKRAELDAAATRDHAVRRIERLIRLEAEHLVGYEPSDHEDGAAHQQVTIDLTLDVLRKIAQRSGSVASDPGVPQRDDDSLRDDSRNRD
jgi:hypothetical protein